MSLLPIVLSVIGAAQIVSNLRFPLEGSVVLQKNEMKQKKALIMFLIFYIVIVGVEVHIWKGMLN